MLWLAAALLPLQRAFATERTDSLINFDWRFHAGDLDDAQLPTTSDAD